ncbi:MAG: bifunctional 4-hydroxy-2-oxoglutarate aldolase/2-dehydro-3-deoxy-phosphogluconate aldolase [Thermoanaerobaculia bacterium]
MARFRRMEVLEALYSTGLVPIFYHGSLEASLKVAAACVEGGSRILEYTNRGDRAHLVFAELAARSARDFPDLILGAGSIGDPQTAAIYLAAGAEFIVSPSFNPEVARLCNRRKVAYVPGCGSSTEIAAAEELGCEIIKLFPADALGGTKFVRAHLGPCPWTSLMPTGGVDLTEASVREWVEAGAACIGMGKKLLSKEAIDSGDFADITRKVRQLLDWIGSARGAD